MVDELLNTGKETAHKEEQSVIKLRSIDLTVKDLDLQQAWLKKNKVKKLDKIKTVEPKDPNYISDLEDRIYDANTIIMNKAANRVNDGVAVRTVHDETRLNYGDTI